MAAPINSAPEAFVPIEQREQLQQELGTQDSTGKKGYPIGLRRFFGALMQSGRPVDNPGFIHTYRYHFPLRKLDARLESAINAVLSALFYHHDYITGVVTFMSERQLAIHCGLATYRSKAVISDKEYTRKVEKNEDVGKFLRLQDISPDEFDCIGHGRISRVISVLKAMSIVEYKDNSFRGVMKRFVGRPLYVTDKFYEVFGFKPGEKEAAERLHLAKQKSYKNRFQLAKIPATLHEARKLMHKAVQRLRAKFYLEQTKFAKKWRQANTSKIDKMSDPELRSHVTRALTKKLAATDSLYELTKEQFLSMVERECKLLRAAKDHPHPKQRNTRLLA